ncbi:MAG TPA: NADH-quinone oxidoreductase subunit C [Vicinamibacterales bacterium]|nr:NADH-quinone oxidoreductase subunit C [Vicinamibacterales bacterium]
MAEDPQKPPAPPQAAADKPASEAPAEPLKGEVSRTDAPGAGASAAPVGTPKAEPPAPKPENPTAAQTATTAETSSATGQPTAPAQEAAKAAPAAATAAKPAAPAPAAAKPAASAAGAAAAPKAAPGAPGAAAAKPAPAAAAGAKPATPAGAKPAAAPHPPPVAAPPSGPTDPPPAAGATIPSFVTSLQRALGDGVVQVSLYVGDWTVIVPVARLIEAATHLRAAPDALFDFCSDVTATDWPPRKDARFDVVYCLYSTRLRHRVRIKVRVGEDQPIASVTGIWSAANWLEREVYDMFGVNFTGHPDRRRILMPEDWQGFPQRKDYPLEGPGELLMENPEDWLKLRQAREQADIE